jgi:hypothetical protein
LKGQKSLFGHRDDKTPMEVSLKENMYNEYSHQRTPGGEKIVPKHGKVQSHDKMCML